MTNVRAYPGVNLGDNFGTEGKSRFRRQDLLIQITDAGVDARVATART